MRRNPERESRLNEGLMSRSLASRKVFYPEVCTEVGGTANVCTEVHEPDKRHARVDEIAQLIEVPNNLALACRYGRGKQKGIYLAKGGLYNHVLVMWISQQRP